MQIIPVIDLLAGRAVHARAGQRSRYAPVCSSLCRDGEPVTLARAYLELFPFAALYLADLDAILGSGDNFHVVKALQVQFPGVTLWVDAGPRAAALTAGVRAVVGSESGINGEHLAVFRQPVLSLDFGAAGFLGDPALLASTRYWPGDVIVMTLARVGTGGGPDLLTASGILRRAGERRVYLAGGVRHRADLEQAAAAGFSGALVATALHDGALNARALATLQH